MPGFTPRLRCMRNDTPTLYVIRVEGVLDGDGEEWFAGMALTFLAGGPGETKISGYIADQAALHSLLNKIRDLGLRLIAVESNP